ncbi:TonB family protein [Sphingomonas sp.]|uniref:TonB family protein n=1 Tax=Sphingomonas sp. TaxID=28214 RepID=UPI0025E5C40E|nr:TonB family protein [Sphingomonas sp.]
MFTFDKSDVQRLAVSMIGAAALTATCVGAAIAPARAATPVTTVDGWQANVERQLEMGSDRYSLRMDSGKRAEAVLAVRFTAEGDYAGAEIARSSGSVVVDRHALNVASHIKYPQLPSELRGQPQTVAMRIYFGRADNQQQLADMQRDVESVRLADAGRIGNGTAAAK